MKYFALIGFALIILTGCGQSAKRSDKSLSKGFLSQDYDYNKPIESWPPSTNLISIDLVGHSLSEGVENGYRASDWTYEIEDGDVSDLNIIEVITQTDNKYLVIAEMKLSKGGNFFYQTKARINYIKSPKDGSPILDYVTSLGMTIVSNGEYDNDIESSYDGFLKNKGEIALTVGGKTMGYAGWERFIRTVPAHSSTYVSVGIIKDCRIDFVIREY